MSFDLRPLTLGELLDRSFSLYRTHFRLFVGLMMLPTVFMLLLNVVMQLLPWLSGRMTAVPPRTSPMPEVAGVLLYIAVFSVAMIVLILGYWAAYMMTLGATTAAVSDIYAGRQATMASAYRRMQGRIGSLLLLLLLIGLRLIGVFAACMILVIPVSVMIAMVARPLGAVLSVVGIFAAMIACSLFAVRYVVAVPALVLEDVRPSAAIRRSVGLLGGNYGRAIVVVLFTVVIAYAAMLLFQGPFIAGAMMAGPESRMAFWLNLAGAVTAAGGGAVTGPLMIIALAVLYYDIRIRKEGLDLDMMIAGLDSHPEPSTPPAVPTSAS